ncbi:MAG: HD domain-containing protein [Chloroflexota bacterium]
MDTFFERVSAALLADGAEAWVVGGAARDRLAGREGRKDIDILVRGPVVDIGRRISARVGASFVVMDEERGHVRLAPRGHDSGQPVWIDMTGLGGALAEDLARRDFTVNAMAVPLQRWADRDIRSSIVDPFNGAGDLEAGVLRETRPGNTLEDPVRMLRAPRLASSLRLSIEDETARTIAANSSRVQEVAGERVRDELFALLGGPFAMTGARELDRLGLLDKVLPELVSGRGVEQPKEHYYDVMEHQLHALDEAERILDPEARCSRGPYGLVPWPEGTDEYFMETVADGQNRATLLKFAALMHDVGKPATKSFEAPTPEHPSGRMRFFGHDDLGADMVSGRMAELRCSRRSIHHVALMVREHLRPSQLSDRREFPTDRAIYRYFRDVSPVAVDTVYLNMADYLAARGPMLDAQDWERYARTAGDILARGPQALESRDPAQNPRKSGLLLNGHEVQAQFDMPPGPEIGRVLEALREAEAEGTVTTKSEARELIARLLGRACRVAGDSD